MMRRFLLMLAVLATTVLAAACTDQSQSEPTAVPTVTPTPTTLRFEVRGKQITAPANVTAKQGEQITIVVTADVTDEVHLHGYDLHADVTKDSVGTLTFTATTAGRFELELENSHLSLGELIIEPR